MDDTELINAETIIFIYTLWEINLKGLKILRSLIIFINGKLTLDKATSIRDKDTIVKSI